VKPRLKTIAKYVSSAAVAVILALASALIWLKLHESQLVFATERSRLHLLQHLPSDSERIMIPGADESAIAGLVFKASPAGAYWILLLHGNADSAFSVTQVRHAEALRAVGFNVLSFDYRGFGESAGIASEAHMYQDSEAALQALEHRGVPLEHIILLGHSLGSGPAARLAVEHRVAALVLFGAFTSIPDAAVERYPHLPVRHIAGVRFDSLARLPEVHVPVVIAHSPTDRVIPFKNAEQLFAAAHEPKRLLRIEAPADPYGGHVDGLFEEAAQLRSTLASLIPDLDATTAPGPP
jgi:pimeloyl-ACP methyl ester carboxylesterase